MSTLVLTVLGDDRPGLVSAVASVVADHDGNWLTGELARLAGKFAGIVLVEVPADQEAALRAALEALAATGLHVTASAAGGPAGPADQSPGATLALSLVGQDRPGIVAQVSAALAAHGVSIEALHTESREAPMAGGLLFEAQARLAAPAGVDFEALRPALEAIADELMVDLELTAD
jgi:glycine cleavage system regulatory protein